MSTDNLGLPTIYHFDLLSGREELFTSLPARIASFAVPEYPKLDPSLLAHRILRKVSGEYTWVIELQQRGFTEDGEDPALEELIAALEGAVAVTLTSIGTVRSKASFFDISIPEPGLGFEQPTVGGVSFGGEDEPGWEAYAKQSGAAQAGAELPGDLIAVIEAARSQVRAEPRLTAYKGGHMYGGAEDKNHLAYLRRYFEERAEKASASDRRRINAFRAFQSREGSTAAINTYDNQIVTWGTGWGGLGSLRSVMARATANNEVREAFGRVGLRYRGNNIYDIVDTKTKRVVTSDRAAYEVMRGSLPILYSLIDAARNEATRNAVTEAQLVTFMESSAKISGCEGIATQALFNLVAHLKHWAPGYVMGCMEWALPQAGDGPSEDRDRRLAVLIGRYFYGKAHKTKWIPDWKQFQLYWHHMKQDGLDCLSDPFIQASGPPTDDPFATTATASGASTTATATAAATTATTTTTAAKTATPAPAETPSLKSATLAGSSELQAIVGGKGALRRGSKGDGVKALQEALISLGSDVPGGADGVFGPGLESAVKSFQAQQKLGADGVVGGKTLLALDAALGTRTAS